MPLVTVVLPARSEDLQATQPTRTEGGDPEGPLTPGYEAAVRSLQAQRPGDVEVVLAGAADDFAEAFCAAVGKEWSDQVRAVNVTKRRKKVPDEFPGAPAPIAGVARARNAGVAAATGSRYVAFLEPGDEWGEGHIEKHVAALEGDSGLGASYARYTLLRPDGSKRTRPSVGRAGQIFEGLVERRQLFYTPSALVTRRDVLVRTLPRAKSGAKRRRAGAFDETLDGVEGLDLLLRLSRDWAVAFVDAAPPVLTPQRREDEGVIERRIRIFIGLLYASRPKLGSNAEKLIRGRLAHELVQLGKLHYSRGDYDRAGRLFNEAAKAAPRYVKGRRYQFLNFVRDKLKGSESTAELDAVSEDPDEDDDE